MALFQKRQDYLAPISTTLGAQVRTELTRDFHIAKIFLVCDVVVSGAIATATADGLLGLINRVTLNVTDGSISRNPIDCSGRALIEYCQQACGGNDRYTLAAKDKLAIGTYKITYPIFFESPQLQDPFGSQLLLPAPRYNANPVLSIQVASQSQIDSNGTPTFAVSSLTITPVVVRREVNIANFNTWDAELVEITQNYTASGANQLYELQVPGNYASILMRMYTSAAARGNNLIANGEVKLQALSNVVRRFRPDHVEIENDFSRFGQMVNTDATGNNSPIFDGSYMLDFLSDNIGESVDDLGGVFDTNILATSGARAQILADVNGGAGVKISYLSHRIFGNLDAFKRRVALTAKSA